MNKVEKSIEEDIFADLDVDKIGIHDYSYLINYMIKWLEGYLKLSKFRFGDDCDEQKELHQEVEKVISNLKCYDKFEDDKAVQKVKRSFMWLSNNIFKLWS